jgi:isoleucyl-tRNA synthetase
VRLGKILEQGYLYQGLKPVNWCLDCGSALAEAEVEHEDKTSPAIDVAFEVHENHAEKLAAAFGLTHLRGPAFAVIWTTTPWTLPANEAVSVHPELTYDLIETEKGALILVRELAEACLKRYGLSGETVASCPGSKLDQILLASLPAARCRHHLRHARHHRSRYRPGAHRAGAWCGRLQHRQAYGLPVNNPVGNDGRFLGNTPALSVGELAGKTVWEANPLVLQELECCGRLLKSEKIKHSYPHCWRHKTPIIFRATTQWFIGMEHKKDENASTLRWIAERAVDETQFFPAWGRARLEAMMKTRPDWCVSRQRNWGVPIPFFLHKETGCRTRARPN